MYQNAIPRSNQVRSWYQVPNRLLYLKFTGLYSHTEGQYPVHTFKEVNGYGEKKFIQSINKFYEPIFQRDRIQQTMEERALQLILKSIVGDPTFSWVGACPYDPRYIGVIGVTR